MPNMCESCPLPKKIRECCGYKPEQEIGRREKAVLVTRGGVRTGEKVIVCPELNVKDGSCNVYGTSQMPERCDAVGCAEWYGQGLGVHR